MDLSAGIAKMDLSAGIAKADLSSIANLLSSGTTTTPQQNQTIIDAVKSLLILKNNGEGLDYRLDGVYDGKEVILVDQKNYDNKLFSNIFYVYKTNELVDFTFTDNVTKQNYKIKLRILNSFQKLTDIKFTATTTTEIPVAPSVYASLILNDGIITTFADKKVTKAKVEYIYSKSWITKGTYDNKQVTLTDTKNIAFQNNSQKIYKVDEIVPFSFTNPVSNQLTSVNLKITKVNDNNTFNAIISPPIAEKYKYIGVL
jgi:hypothetical protein